MRQQQRRTSVIQHDLFHLFGQPHGGDAGEAEFREGRPRGAELSDAAVYEDQAGHDPALVAQAGVTPRDGFGDRARVVRPFHGADVEAPVEAAVGLAVHGRHHARGGVGAEEVGDVETLDQRGVCGQAQHFAQLAHACQGVGGTHGWRRDRAPAPRDQLAQRQPCVAQSGGLLEIVRGGALTHLCFDLLDDPEPFAAQKGAGLCKTLPVLVGRDAADAGGGTETDDVV